MTPQSDRERQDAVERTIRHYPEPLVDARELTEAVLDETDAFDELADPRREVLEVLRVLERTGDVVSQRPGANAITWAHVDRVIRDPPPRDPADHPDQADLKDTPASGDGREPADNTEARSAANESVAAFVDLPAGVDADAAEDAIRAAEEYLRDEGSGTKAAIVGVIMPEHPLGYDVDEALAKINAGERYRGAWWRRVVKPGLEEIDAVEKPPRGRSEWRVEK